jgi:hypothetical protein
LEEIAKSQGHEATKGRMGPPPEKGPKGRTDDNTSRPPARMKLGIAQGWSNAMRYKFGIQQEASKIPVDPKTAHANKAVAPSDLCDSIKQEHDVTKAMKADDAAVPVHLWDEAFFRGLPSPVEKKVLVTLQDCVLGKYRLHLWREARRICT